MQEKYDYLYSQEQLEQLLPEIRALEEEAGHVHITFNNNNPIISSAPGTCVGGVRS